MRYGALLASLYAICSGYLLIAVVTRTPEAPLFGIGTLLAVYFIVQAVEMTFKRKRLDGIGAAFFTVELALCALAIEVLEGFSGWEPLRLMIAPWGFSGLLFVILILPVANRLVRRRAYREKMTGGKAYYETLTVFGVAAAVTGLFWQSLVAQALLLAIQLAYAIFYFANAPVARLLGGQNEKRRQSLLRDPAPN